MEVVDETVPLQILGNTIDDLPDEVLEFIFGFLPPYKDLQDCMCVCRRWYSCGQNVMRKTSNKLVKAIAEFKIQWKNITPVDMAPTITKRFSHAACVYENSMYIFGGCTTNSTAFNDLWRFDLSKRQWIRPLAMGTYPVPKAYTSMVCYKDDLVLFGGWTYPSPSQYYQNVTMFNEIHFYNVSSNRWTLVHTVNNPPPMAGHSAYVQGNEMVVFGGLIKAASQQYHIQCSNDVWVLDLELLVWRKQATSEPRPSPRYAQSLVALDGMRAMLLGGVQTPHNRFVYNDCWILSMKGSVWAWQEVSVKNKEWAAANIWCNPACRVGDKVVSLSRCKNGRWSGGKPLVTSAVRLAGRPPGAPVAVRVEQSLRRPLDRDQNINGKRGVFTQRQTARVQKQNEEQSPIEPKPGPSHQRINTSNESQGTSSNENDSPESSSGSTNRKVPEPRQGLIALDCGLNSRDNSIRRNKALLMNKPNGLKIVRQLHDANKYRMAAFACDTSSHNAPPENNLINQRQIAHLERRPEVAVAVVEPPPVQPALKKFKRNTLTMHVLDIATVLDGNTLNYVSWLCPRQGETNGAPEELVMYSLVRGKGELIMFGGVHNDVNMLNNFSAPQQYLYSNSLHFITPPRDII